MNPDEDIRSPLGDISLVQSGSVWFSLVPVCSVWFSLVQSGSVWFSLVQSVLPAATDHSNVNTRLSLFYPLDLKLLNKVLLNATDIR